MTSQLIAVRAKCLNRLKRAIAKNGPLTWSAARLAMWGGQYDTRDARFHNETILEWIAAGDVARIEQEDGDSLIGLAN